MTRTTTLGAAVAWNPHTNSLGRDNYYPHFQMDKLSPVVLLAIISGQMLTGHRVCCMKPF